MKKKIFYVYGWNHTDRRDDEVWKVRAKDKKEAKEWAKNTYSHRFGINQVLSGNEMRKERDGWWAILRTTRPTEI